MMLIGADSWFPPGQAELDALKLLVGFKFYGGYVGGAGLYLNTPWPKYNWDLLKSNNIAPLPIWVPKQDCSENPVTVADEAMSATEQMGMSGVVAFDSEYNMSLIPNFQHWLDVVFTTCNESGWHPVDYAGAHYLSPLAFHWEVVWGEHEDIPPAGTALQYGPYMLRTPQGTNLMEVDADSADESFPFANWVGEAPQPQPPILVPPKPNTNVKEDALFRFSCTVPGHADYVVFPNGKVHGIPNQAELDEWVASGIPGYPFGLATYEIVCQNLGI